MKPNPEDRRAAFRLLPAVDEVLRQERLAGLLARTGTLEVSVFVRRAVNGLRRDIDAGLFDGLEVARHVGPEQAAARAEALFEEDRRRGIPRAINATGVVLHTGLGRAPIHPEVAARMAEAARGYCILEVERESGKRGRRDDYLSELLTRLTGCEAAIAVNNNAAAVFLCLQTFAAGGEAVVSRGELVEIGGSFRVPEVMLRAGVRLREVGTTNRTRAADYQGAINEHTGLLLKVHTSNFKVTGFTEEVSMEDLAALGRESKLVTAFDLGSGLFEYEGTTPLGALGEETVVSQAVASGIDVVTFSGDKLFGGPQAGVLVGKRESIDALRANPVYRALRLDKVSLSGLEGTLQLLLDGRGDEIPARVMLRMTAEELASRAEELAGRITALPGFSAEVALDQSQPGSGSAPDVFLDTWVVRVRHASLSAEALGRHLRVGQPPVFTRIQDDALLCDPRTLTVGELEELAGAFAALVERTAGSIE